MTYWLPVDDVVSLIVYNSLDDANKAVEASKRAEKKSSEFTPKPEP